MSETNIRPVRETQTKNEIVNGSRRVLKRSRSRSPVTTRASEAAEEGDVESSLEAASLCPIPSFDYDASRSGSHNSSRAPVSMKVRHRGDIPPRNASTSSVSSSSRSNLFPSDDRSGSRSSSRVDSSTFRPSPSRHGNSSRSRIPTNASSLFGAVMQQVQSEALPADDPRSYPTASPAPQTPQPHHHNMHTNVHDFLNSFQSPFFVPDERDSASTPVPLTPRTPQNDPQWRETRLDQFVTDWSLHTRVHLAGQPHLSVADTNRYSHQGIQHFTLYSQSYGSNGGPPVAPPVRWEAARCYWQYPVEPSNPDISTARVQPLATTTAPLQDTSQDNTRRGTGSKLAPDQFFAQPFTDPTASRNPTVGIRKPYASNPKRTIPLEREWQQAFQSLYHTWVLRIRAFNQLLIPHRDPSIVPHCYFYAVHPSRAVLFRTRLIPTKVHDHKVGDSEESVDGLTLQPEILVSQSTRAMRDFLRSHEIRFAPVDIHGVFPENDDTHANLDGKFQNTVASPGTKADLEALRRAQVSGKTVGADVSVVRKPRSAPLVMDDPAPHALLIAGHDDCAAAADLCFNTLGHWGVSPRDRTGPLPKLLARGLGPFAHASLQSLRVIKNRGLDHTVESLEIQGYVLPCALPNLVQAIVAGLRSDQAHGRNASEAIHPHQTNLVGSHHVVLQTTALHSPPSTAWLNCKILPTGFDRGTVPQCRNGQRLEMAVWDIQKPATLAYKLEQTRLF